MSTLSEMLTPIDTETEATNWIVDLARDVERLRNSIDSEIMVVEQKKLYTRFMMKSGEALGALQACKRCNRLSDEAYNKLRIKILDAQKPTVIVRP